MPSKIYEFNEFQLDLSQKTLRKNGEIVGIQPKIFDMLTVFVERNNDLISRDELMKAVWGDTFVEETSLRLGIHTLRKIFDGKIIETVPKRGYRFNAEVREILPEPSKNEPLNSPTVSKAKFAVPLLILIAIVGLFAFYNWQKQKNSTDKRTIAVLPFTKIGEKSERNLPVTDAVIAQLSKLKDFQILPVNTVQKYAEQEFDAVVVGKELGSDAVLQGSFRQENNLVRVRANLQNLTNGEILWTENFEVKADQNYDLENSIAARLAQLFSLKMVEYDDEKSAKTQKVNSEALNAYLSARKIWRSRDLGRVAEMGLLFQKVVELEPNWADAHSANAESLLMDDFVVTVFDKAEKVANIALEKDEKQYGAMTVLGQVATNRHWDFAKAESFFKKSIELNPTYASTYNEYAKLLLYQKKFAESERVLKKGLEIEPFSPLYNTTLCEIYYYDQKLEAALKQCKLVMQFEPNFWLARKQLFWIYVVKKMNKEVAEMILEKHSDEAKVQLPYYKSLQNGELIEYWKSSISATKSNSYNDAMIYMQLNDREKVLSILENSQENPKWLAFRIGSDPIFVSLWQDDRFYELVKKLEDKSRS